MTHKKITKISLRKLLISRFFVLSVFVLIFGFSQTSYAFNVDINSLISSYKNYVKEATPQTNIVPVKIVNVSTLTTAYKNYLKQALTLVQANAISATAPIISAPSSISSKDLTTAYKNFVSGNKNVTPLKVITSNSNITTANLNQAILKILNSPEMIAKLRGPAGAPGQKGDKGDPSTSSGQASFPTPYISSPSSTPVQVIPLGVTIPNATYNFSGGAYENIANLSSNLFTTNTANITDVNISGTSTLKGSLSVAGDATLSGNLNVTGTITGSIVGSMNPNLTNGSVFFQGPSGVSQDNANLFWDSTNHRLGVGTTSPGQKLDVNGIIRGTSGYYNELMVNAGNVVGFNGPNNYLTYIYSPTGADLGLRTNGAERMRIDSSGNVGIGTTGPGYKLEVSGELGFPSTTNTDRIILYDSGSGNRYGFGIDGSDLVGFAHPSGGISFKTSSYGGTSLMRIQGNGNVGIGTVSPGQKLDVAGSARVLNNLYLTNTATNPYLSYGTISNSWTFADNNSYYLSVNTNGGASLGSTYAGTNAPPANGMIIQGNVGIGTTSPAQKFQVQGTTNATSQMVIKNSVADGIGNSASLLFAPQNSFTGADSPAGNVGASIKAITENTYSTGLALSTFNQDTGLFQESVRIKYNGNVGIGTTNPDSPLAISANTASLQAPPTTDGLGDTIQPLLHVGGTNGQEGAVIIDGYGAPGTIIGRRANGTAASPTSLAFAGYNMFYFQTSGYTSAGAYSNPQPAIGVTNSQAWTSTNQGTQIDLYTTSNNATTSTERMTIANSGNVGIGDVAPGTKLSVVGNASVGYASGQTAPANGLIISGNVGIGTTNPTHNLDIKAASVNTTVAQYLLSGGNGTGELDYLANNGTYVGGFGMLGHSQASYRSQTADMTYLYSNAPAGVLIDSDNANGPILFTTGGASTYQMVIDKSGNVGIGTVSPGAQLHISTAAAGVNAFRYTDATNYTISGGYQASGVGYLGGNNGTQLALWSNGSERVRIDSSGNVGIGTVSPGAYLDINPTYTGASTTTIYNDRSGFTLNNGAATITNYYGKYISAPTLTAGAITNKYALVTEAGAGNVGIGTTNPGYKLQVSSGTAFDGIDIVGTSVSNPNGIYFHNGSEVASFQLYGSSASVAPLTGNAGFGSSNGVVIYTDQASATGGTHDIFLSAGGYNNTELTISHTGNVGIGTTSPAASLHVVGNTLMQSTSANALQIKQANGTQVLTLDTRDTYSGTGTGTTGAPRLYLGTNTSSGDDSAILIGRNIAGDSLFSHAVRDESTFTSGPTTGAYTSFDSQYTVTGSTAPYNHFRSFQSRPIYSGTGGVGELNGFYYQPTVNGAATNVVGLHVQNPLGSGAISTFTGISIDAITDPNITTSYALYSSGASPSYFGGNLQSGGNILTTAGTITGGTINSNGSIGATTLFSVGAYQLYGTHGLTYGNYTQNSIAVGTISGGGAYPWIISSGNGGSSTGGYVSLQTDGTERMRVTNNGIGIGTSTPSTALAVRGTGTVDPFDVSSSSNSSLLRITSSGNLGIGTTGPATPLEVVGTIRASRSGVPSNYASMTYDTSYGQRFDGSFANTTIGAAGAVVMTLQSAGNVGIGTSAPSALLGVGASNQFTVTSAGVVTGVNFLGQNAANAFADVAETNSGFGFASGDPTISKAGTVYFRLNGNGLSLNNGTTAAGSGVGLIVGSGNVGIGTTAPGTKLDVLSSPNRTTFQNNNFGVLNVNSGDGSNNLFSDMTFSDFNGYKLGRIGAYKTNSGSYLYFGTSNSYGAGTTNNGMVMDYNGNVGIGTTGPSQLLSVGASNQFTVDSSGNVIVGTTIKANGDLSISSGLGGGAHNLNLSASGGNSVAVSSQLYMTGANYLSFGTQETMHDASGLIISSIDTAHPIKIAGGALLVGYTSAGEAYPAGNLLVNGNVGIGTTSPITLLTIGNGTPTTAANGLNFGSDTAANLYRSGSSTIKTDGGLIIGSATIGSNSLAVSGTAFFGGNVAVGASNTPTKTLQIGASGNSVTHAQAIFAGYDSTTGFPQLLFNNPGSNYMGEGVSTAGDLVFGSTGGTTWASQQMVIQQSTGNVGIGTTGPNDTLDVNGNIKTRFGDKIWFGDSSVIDYGYKITASSGVFDIYTGGGTTDVTRMYAGGSERVRFGGSAGQGEGVNGGSSIGASYYTTAAPANGMIIQGNVGIGTTNPNALLTVSTTMSTSLSPVAAINTTGNKPLLIGETSGHTGIMLGYAGNDIQGRSDANFGTNADLYINKFGGNVLLPGSGVWQSNGNVGIGMTSPSALLTVGNSNSLTVDNSGHVGIGITPGASIPLTFAATTGQKFDLYSGGGYSFGVESNEFRFNVGTTIGKFSFKNAGYASASSIMEAGWNPTLASNVLSIGDSAANAVATLSIKGTGSVNPFNVASSSGTSLMVINNQGNVGIGTTNPGTKLDVNGGVTFRSNGATGVGDVNVCITTGGVITQGGTCGASSQKVKDNVLNFTGGLSDIMKLKPVTFNYKFGYYGGKQDIGFIAEDVAVVDPRFAIYAQEDKTLPDGSIIHAGDPMALDTSAILSATVASVQELNLNLEGIAGTVTPVPGSANESFVASLFSNLKAKMLEWLGEKVETKQLCVKKSDGTDVCVNGDQLNALLSNTNNVLPPSGGTPPPTPPAVGSTDPAIGSTTPAIGNTQPAVGSTDPAIGSTQPAVGSTDPAIGTTSPAVGTTSP